MNYWIALHIPPYENEPPGHLAEYLWLREGDEGAGKDLDNGDLVFIYQQQKPGRTIEVKNANGSIHHLRGSNGKGRVVALAEVTGTFVVNPDPWERYTDGTEACYRWHAPLKWISRSGFVSRAAVLSTLGYKPTYKFMAFGDGHSGLKKLQRHQFEELRELYRSSVPFAEAVAGFGGYPAGAGKESQTHLQLKKYVAANPSKVFNEPGVTWIATEYSFKTGDCADVVLRDQFGRIIGLEVELDILPGDITGPLQAVKYRRMLEMVTGIRHGDGRAVLVAYSIPADIQSICERYDVKCIEIAKADVQSWLQLIALI